jgi:hypothetical protein
MMTNSLKASPWPVIKGNSGVDAGRRGAPDREFDEQIERSGAIYLSARVRKRKG